MSLASALDAARAVLQEQGVRWCVVGGLAVATRTPARFTVDVDLAVAVRDDTQAEALTMGFLGAGFTLVAALEHEATGRLASVRLRRGPGEEVDLMFALVGIEAVIVEASEPIEVLTGHIAPTACVEHLAAMKLLSVDGSRPRDAQDLIALLQQLTPDGRKRLDTALAAIQLAGTSRGRDLPQLLATWLDRC